MEKKRIVFLTGTRADFGKLKSLIEISSNSEEFDVHIFATGMHMQSQYGYTVDEIVKCGYKNIEMYVNWTSEESMDKTLAKTIEGFSDYVKRIKPDLIVIHGDRVETLAGAIVGSLNNKLVAHIEGGEVSGTIDELLRHSTSKLSHIHFVSSESAKKRLIQMGELSSSIYVIGSPDIDIMVSNKLPSIEEVKNRYDITFEEYAILLFHSVTTENGRMPKNVEQVVDAVLESELNYVVIYPNNDLGSECILNQYKRFENNPRFRVFPSIRFEYFLVLLKMSKLLVGNSSAGIREAPYYGVPVVNIGTRQNNRTSLKEIHNCGYSTTDILDGITKFYNLHPKKVELFGQGNSNNLFLETLKSESLWNVNPQKQFNDIEVAN